MGISEMVERQETAAMWRLASLVAGVVGLFREVASVQLSDAECEASGVPYGATERAVFAHPVANGSRWHFDVWDDGQNCVNVRLCGWSLEVHYMPPAPAAA